MATTFGFFNAKKMGDDYDRKYSADNLAEYFDPIVGSGVSVNEENGYQLKAQSGLNVLLESGFAWIKGYYIRDTTATKLTFEAAPSAQSRYDAVILRLSKANRTVEKLIIKGAEGPTPQPPDLTRTADTYELMLGYVVRKAGTSSITQDMIVDTREDPILCGLIDTFAARLVPDGSITTVKLADGSVTTDKLASDVKVLAFTNKAVAVSDWASDTTYTDFPYRAAVACQGVTVKHYAAVVFSPEDAMSGCFAPVAASYDGGVYLYASEIPEAVLTIPTIVCTPVE